MQKQNGQEFFSFESRNHGVWVWGSYLLKLESNFGFKCFQLWFCDCLSTNGLYGRCMNGLHIMSLPGSSYPSRPAYGSNWNLKSMLELLQIVVKGLHHVYDVCWWCLDEEISICSGQSMDSKFKAVLASLWTWNVKTDF